MTPRENPALIGHEAAAHAFEESLASSRLHHAWLITGPEGVGKATLAFRFARRLLAGGQGPIHPDHPVFRRVAAGSHADLLTIEREIDDKTKKLKKNISAEAARGVPPFLHLTPAEGGWRVVIVDGAEDVNPQSANALLKVLEEPPKRALILLLAASPGRLLPTVRSRCRRLSLSPLSDADMSRLLADRLPDLGAAERARLIELAGGSPGRALALAEDQGLMIAGLVDTVLAPGFAPTRAYEIADKLGRGETGFEIFMQLLRAAIAAMVTREAREGARPSAAWGAIWERLGQLQDETERFNLDRRQAVVAGLNLL